MNEVNEVIIINGTVEKVKRLKKQVFKFNVRNIKRNLKDIGNKPSIVILDADYVYEDDLVKYILGTDFEKKNVVFKDEIKRIYDVKAYLNHTIVYEVANINHFFLSKDYDEETLKKIDNKEIFTDVSFVDVKSLVRIEDYDRKRALKLKNIIISDNAWTVPIIVEKKHHLILDGHHRFEVAKALGFSRIPAILVDYNDIDVWSLRKEIFVDQETVIKHAYEENKIYPYKTVKHKYNFLIPEVNYNLGDLK